MIISISGFTVEESLELQTICSFLNFEFSSALISGTCVLIASNPFSSLKIKAALHNNIPIVSRFWLEYLNRKQGKESDAFAVIDRFKMNDVYGKVVSLTGYSESELKNTIQRVKLLGGIYSPVMNQKTDFLVLAKDTHKSQKLDAAKKWFELRHFTRRNIKVVSGSWIATKEPFALRLTIPDIDQKVIDDDLPPAPTANNGGEVGVLAASSSILSVASAELAIDNHSFLDGLNIFIGQGFGQELLIELRKMIRNSGGSYMQECSDFVSHFICAKERPAPQDLDLITDSMLVVSYNWLKQCHISKSRIPVTSYLVNITPVAEQVPKLSLPRSNSLTNKAEVKSISNPTVISLPKDLDQEMKLKPANSAAGGIFANCTFSLSGFEAKENSVIAGAIVNFGGQISKDSLAVDPRNFNVVPFGVVLNSNHGLNSTVTEFFIEKCIQEGKLLSIKESILFQPTKSELPLKDFSAQCIGITGFSENEKFWVSRIITMLGGQLTDSFSRKNTGLISNPTVKSQKTVKAKEWGIPVLDLHWLYQCVDQGRVVPTKNSPTVRSEVPMRQSKAAQYFEKSSAKSLKDLSKSLTKNLTAAVDTPFVPKIRPIASPIKQKRVPVTSSPSNHEVIQQTLACLKRADSENSPPPAKIKRAIIKIEEMIPLASDQKRKKFDGVGYVDSAGEREQLRIFESLDPSKPKKFMFSGLANSERDFWSQKILDLGGIVLDDDTWTNECTHLIISKVAKTEKFLSACAGCAWILKVDYLENSIESGSWLQETDFCSSRNDFAEAALHWKNIHSRTGLKPFSSWNVYISVDKSRRAGFERLLCAGGAKIITQIDSIQDKVYFLYDKLTDEAKTVTSKYPHATIAESAKVIDWLLSSGRDAFF